METSNVLPAQATEFARQTSDLVDAFTGYSVTTSDEMDQGAEDRKLLKKQLKALEDMRMSITRPMDDAKRRVMDFFRKPEEQIKAALKIIDAAMLTYDAEVRRLQAEEKAKAEAAERQRQEDERKRLEAEAAKALAKGHTVKAEALVERAEEVAAAPVEVRMAEIKHVGVSVKTYWRARVVDFSKVPDEFKVIDEKKINAMATATKGPSTIPGVEFYSETGLAGR